MSEKITRVLLIIAMICLIVAIVGYAIAAFLSGFSSAIAEVFRYVVQLC